MILSDFPIFIGVKWLKYSCNVATKTSYQEWLPVSTNLSQTRKNNQQFSCYTGYTFSRETGFEGTGHFMCYGNAMSGYMVNATDVWEWANGVDLGNGYTEYRLKSIAHADTSTTTTYSKGDTLYDSVYVDKNELPDDGQLIEGSANDSYCVIKVGETIYYYEKGN